MADTKLTALTELNETPASGDWLYIVDVSDTTDGANGSSRKITRTNAIGGLATSGANSSITSLTGLTTALTVAQGGTGVATITSGELLVGAGTGAITSLGTSGTGNVVRVTSPTLATPDIGVATATSVNKVTITAPTTSATLTLVTGSSLITVGAYAVTLTSTGTTGITLPTTGTLTTLAGTETFTNKTLTTPIIATISNSGTITIPTGTDTLVGKATTDTLTNKTLIATTNVVEEISTIADSATPTPTGGSLRNFFTVTALAQAATFAAPSGTPANSNKLIIRIKDNATARALTWNGIYRAMGTALPSTTVLSKTLYLGFIYSTTDTKWDLVSSAQEA